MSPAPAHPIAVKLLDWFGEHARHLPWRQARGHGIPRDAYRAWVAEIMLQQTQVATVIPYYRAFVERFPSVNALAAADLDDVLKAWEGLGYYARARNLHAAARLVQQRHAGRIPRDRAALLALPGIGEYTANAILSMAYAQDVPALDANARRVLARLYAITEPLDRPATLRRLEALARQILPTTLAGPFNEALMDLGALVCTPRAPDCRACPLRQDCRAYAQGLVERIPARRARRVIPHYDVTAAIIWRDGRVLLAQRPADRMLGGLWEFPGGKCEPGEALADCLRREINEELGVEIEVGAPLVSVEHAYTHLRITLHAFHCRLLAGAPRALEHQDIRWVAPDEIAGYALSVADQRVAAALLAGGAPAWKKEGET